LRRVFIKTRPEQKGALAGLAGPFLGSDTVRGKHPKNAGIFD
jgi:hypothetical protein